MTGDKRIIDEVAAAIYETEGRRPAPIWQNASSDVRQWVRTQAKSAIAAVRAETGVSERCASKPRLRNDWPCTTLSVGSRSTAAIEIFGNGWFISIGSACPVSATKRSPVSIGTSATC